MMKDAVHIVPVNAEAFDKEVAEAIAEQTGAPLDLAARTYREELLALAREARIPQFVNLIASRRARLKLTRH